ncbi:hypothetical protein HMPREF0072_0306 [Anaerococcus lactolyticus ATCC 51172]|uniref:Transglycosylase SLT domain protein n=1 Tax=Anaerococcus lactolyticus ATCC 51172 TaxID=525254 RepID=C2BD86_9FIRM|nr:hypothetical protein [Anaerococcus lactolyticus]EEI87073.1 hypothetical protein HMPREF0072_0306 [Anaerococcus lactolyticus ATCC 51172]
MIKVNKRYVNRNRVNKEKTKIEREIDDNNNFKTTEKNEKISNEDVKNKNEEKSFKKVENRYINKNKKNKETNNVEATAFKVDDNERKNYFDKGYYAGKYVDKKIKASAKGAIKFVNRELMNESRSDESLKIVQDYAYYGRMYGGLAKNIGVEAAVAGVNKIKTAPLITPKGFLKGDIRIDTRSINQRLNDLSNKGFNRVFGLENSNIEFFKNNKYKNLKNIISTDSPGKKFTNKKIWNEYLKEKGLDKSNLRKYKLISKTKYNVSFAKLLYADKEFLLNNIERRNYAKTIRKFNKIKTRRIKIKNSSKQGIKDYGRKIIRDLKKDSNNLALSGLGESVDIHRNYYKAGKALIYKPGKNITIKTSKQLIKGVKNRDKIKSSFKLIKSKSVKGYKSLAKTYGRYRRLYKSNGLGAVIKDISKNTIVRAFNLLKKLMIGIWQAMKAILAMMLGAGFFAMITIGLIMAVTIVLGNNRSMPLTDIQNESNVYQGEGVDLSKKNYGEDIKKHFDYIRELTKELDEKYRSEADIVNYLQNPDNAKAILSLISVENDNDLSDKNKDKIYKAIDNYHEKSHKIDRVYFITHKVGETTVVLKCYDIKTDELPSDIVKVANPYTRLDKESVSSGTSSSSNGSIHNHLSNPEASGSVKNDFDSVVKELRVSDVEKKHWEYIISKESGWNPSARNPSSGAYGLGQAYPPEKMKSYGEDWQTNPKTQLLWMHDYMINRYGSITKAYNYWIKNHWY